MTHPPRQAGDPQPLTAAEINERDIVEIIMTAPLDQAVTIAVGRASTCWEYPDGMGGQAGVFDDGTAVRIVNALLSRISAELATGAAEAKGEDAARVLIPTLAYPTEVRDRQQCPATLRLEGDAQHSQCLLLDGHDGDEHQNGNLRWRKDPETGGLLAWWDTQVYEVVTLADLLRTHNVALTLPHLPAGAAEELARERQHARDLAGPPVEIDVGPLVRHLEANTVKPDDPEE